MTPLTSLVPAALLRKYEVREWRHASAILAADFPAEWRDILDVLASFRLRKSDIAVGGGNKSNVARAIDTAFAARGWREKHFDTRPYKTRKDGGPDGRGVGFYFRNVTELVLFGTRGSIRTDDAGRQVNLIAAQKTGHSRKPEELYDVIEDCSYGPYLELFARTLGRAGCSGATRSSNRAATRTGPRSPTASRSAR